MENKTVDSALFAGIIFLICIVVAFQISPGIEASEEKSQIIEQREVVIADEDIIEFIHDDDLEIPLPENITSDEIIVNYDFIEKRVNVGFEAEKQNFDVSTVVNKTGKTSRITYNSDSGKMNIEIGITGYYKAEWIVDERILHLRLVDIDRSKPIVLIDPGHGGNDVGANVGDVFEKDINLSVCKKIINLNKENIQLFLTRTEDYYHSVEERANFANEFAPDLFVSVHTNWYDNSEVNGTSVLYNSLNGTEKGTSYWLANILDNAVSKSMGTADMGLEDGKSIYVVRYTNMPAALVEMGFITNPTEFNILVSEDGRNNAAKGIYEGIIKAINELK